MLLLLKLKLKSSILGSQKMLIQGLVHEWPAAINRVMRWPDSRERHALGWCASRVSCPVSGLRCPTWALKFCCCCYSVPQSCLSLTPWPVARQTPPTSAVLQSFLRFMSLGSVRYRAKALQTLPGGGQSRHTRPVCRCEKRSRTKEEVEPARPLGKGCHHLPAEAFPSVSDQCQATVGSQSAHPPRRREPLLSSALGAVHHHTGRGGPAPLERSFYPERLTTNRSMSEKNEAGRWGGGGLLLCRERPERATPPPQMTSGQRSADVKGETGRRVGESIPAQEVCAEAMRWSPGGHPAAGAESASEGRAGQQGLGSVGTATKVLRTPALTMRQSVEG